MSITPSYLKHGDKVAIISTARKISLEELQPSIQLLKEWGLEPVLAPNLFAEENQFAGSDVQRAEDLQAMLDDENIKAIWCARGGYGTIRIIDNIDFSKFQQNPKWIIGYSDVTVLHSHIHQQYNIETLHATMPVNIAKNTDACKESLRKTLFGELLTYAFEKHAFNRNGEAKGQLVGGNLSMLYSMLGSETSIDTKSKILFIEDLDEYLYHIDRMMQNLKRNVYFNQLSGLVVGSMSDMNDNTIPFGKTAKEIIRDTVAEYNFPICFDFPAGHIDDNRSLILGREVSLKVNDNPTLQF